MSEDSGDTEKPVNDPFGEYFASEEFQQVLKKIDSGENPTSDERWLQSETAQLLEAVVGNRKADKDFTGSLLKAIAGGIDLEKLNYWQVSLQPDIDILLGHKASRNPESEPGLIASGLLKSGDLLVINGTQGEIMVVANVTSPQRRQLLGSRVPEKETDRLNYDLLYISGKKTEDDRIVWDISNRSQTPLYTEIGGFYCDPPPEYIYADKFEMMKTRYTSKKVPWDKHLEEYLGVGLVFERGTNFCIVESDLTGGKKIKEIKDVHILRPPIRPDELFTTAQLLKDRQGI